MNPTEQQYITELGVASILHRLRIQRAVEFYNAHANKVAAREHPSGDIDYFKWNLVWQEILMFIRMADPDAPRNDLQWLHERRGFTLVQAAFLAALCEYCWFDVGAEVPKWVDSPSRDEELEYAT
jgi:hypothetical protein